MPSTTGRAVPSSTTTVITRRQAVPMPINPAPVSPASPGGGAGAAPPAPEGPERRDWRAWAITAPAERPAMATHAPLRNHPTALASAKA